jgi:tryptophanyl-tRNA synthetase
VPGTDGEKMSKSYNNTIEIFEDGKAMRKKIMRIVTDSRPMEEPKDPDTDHLYQLYSPVRRRRGARGDGGQVPRGRIRLRRGQEGAGRRRGRLFRRARERRSLELAAHPEKVREILGDGAQRARRKAGEVAAGSTSVRIEGQGMNVIGIGTDIVETLRIAQMIERHGDLF